MKIAIIGSRSVTVSDLTPYVPHDCSEIVSGGARGVDLCAAKFAKEKGIKLTEFLPNYKKYGRSAPLLRNKLIVEYADSVIAFWDGASKGTAYVIKLCEESNKPCKIVPKK